MSTEYILTEAELSDAITRIDFGASRTVTLAELFGAEDGQFNFVLNADDMARQVVAQLRTVRPLSERPENGTWVATDPHEQEVDGPARNNPDPGKHA